MSVTSPKGEKKPPVQRINRQFIGLGHQFQSKKRTRKQLDLEQKTLQNQVSYLHKQKQRAHKYLLENQERFRKLVNVQERHQNDLNQKARLKQQWLEEEERLREKNIFDKMMRKTRRIEAQMSLREKNKMDHDRIKRLSKEGLSLWSNNKKKQDLQKKNSWMASILRKETGRNKLQSFYLRKNKQYIHDYNNRISLEVGKSQQRIYSINELEQEKKKAYQKLKSTAKKIDRINEKIIARTNSRIDSSRCSETFENFYGKSEKEIRERTNFVEEEEIKESEGDEEEVD